MPRTSGLSVKPPEQLSLPWWSGDLAPPPAPTRQPAPASAPSIDLPSLTPLPNTTAPPGAAHPASFSCTPDSASAPLAHVRQADPEGLAVFRHPQAQHELRLGHALVAFELKRVRRRSIGMVVSPEGLSVRAPRWAGWGEIEQVLLSKSRWICTKLAEQRQRASQHEAARIDWREGATLPFLGEPVILVLDERQSGVRLNDEAQALPGVARRTLHLGLPQQASAEQIRDTVSAWLQRQAREYFAARVQHFAQQLGVTVSKVSLSSARTRWGSASADGSVRLHWRLVHFSPAIIDYVVAHELAHLREMNHSPRFWGVVASVLPDYDLVRQQLRQAVIPEA